MLQRPEWVETGPSLTRVGATGLRDSGYSPAHAQDHRGSTPKAAVPACPAGDLLLCPRCCIHRPVLLCDSFLAVLLDEDGMHRRRFIALLGTTIIAART